MKKTIPHTVLSASKQWQDKPAIKDGSIQLSFQQVEHKARQVAQSLLAFQVQQGDRIAIWVPNIHEWVWIAIGIQMVGAIIVPINTRYKGNEASDIINVSECTLLFTMDDFLDNDYLKMLNGFVMPKLQHKVILRAQNLYSNNDCQSLKTFLHQGKSIAPSAVDAKIVQLSDNDISDIMYTSGTTGKAKGVMSSHRQIVDTFTAWSNAVNLTDKDRYLIVNPFFHTFGYKAGWFCCFLKGATAYPQAFFDAEAQLALIEQEQISFLPGAPTIYQSLLNCPTLNNYNYSSLRCAVTGAATVPESLITDMYQRLGFTEIYTGYGLTECGVVSICRKGDSPEIVANTAGKAIEGIEVKIVDEHNHTLPKNTEGLVKVKGFNVMQGYFKDKEATEQTIVDGWLDTGDIGWKNENDYIKITDRAKDMFICGGFNCYPAEIENRLLEFDAIIDVAVIGIEEQRLGEVGHAFIVMKNTQQTNGLSANLEQWCRERMANYKVPRYFTIVDSLPRNASGKVEKYKLKSQPPT